MYEVDPMPFGYSPRQGRIADFLLKIFGWPNWMRRLQGPAMVRALSLEATDRVLDLGCGSGPFTFEMSKTSSLVAGVDVALGSMAAALSRSGRIAYVLADGRRLPFRDACFSKALLSSLIQMVSDPARLMQEVGRVLEEGGLYVLSAPTDHVVLPRLYHRFGETLRSLGFPGSYEEFTIELAKRFHAFGSGILGEGEVESLVAEAGSRIVSRFWLPGKVTCSIYEFLLMIAWRTGLPLSSYLYFPLLYPLGWLERKLPKKRGNEIIVLAERRVQKDGRV